MIDFRFILCAILFVNILQLPQTQKLMGRVADWFYVQSKYKARFIKKWSRRFYYLVKELLKK